MKAILTFSVGAEASKELSTSTKDPAFRGEKPLIRAVLPDSPKADNVAGTVAFVLTRSAQDFGAALAGGDDVVTASSGFAGLTSGSSCETDEEASPAGNGASATPRTFVEVDAALTETLWPFLGLIGICGITGTTGTNGTAGLNLGGLLCAAGGCNLEGTSGGAAEDGVVGRVESASEGACEVTGVSPSDVAGTGGLQSL